ncbi:MAG: ZIP family metal transporter [Burkholderiaceae bacterium]|jgi:zinc and cadmium transporter|nr:ZIP family metal transporter [Burkholderiaceae bacterium]
MRLIAILIGTLLAGVGSVWVAAALSWGVLARYTQHMLSLAAGALLATAFMKLLPEAFDSGVEAHTLSATLLAGLLFFFLLDKAELWHHGHEHRHNGQEHEHDRERDHGQHRHGGGWAVLLGDSVHCFGDGVLIASAFMADLHLGVSAALAVLVHEVPHHIGDLAVLRSGSGDSRRAALLKVSLAGALTALGGLAGYALIGQLEHWLPYLLVLAASSFIYVALADLIPQLQKHLNARETAAQVLWLAAGLGLVMLVGALAAGHAH